MKYLMVILDSLITLVQRNPLTFLLILILALGAPALVKGIALFILYFLLGLVVLATILALVFRWRINKVRRQMEEQFGGGFEGFGSPFGSGSRPRSGREGEVKVYKTSETPEKRVSKNVGDYVEFEEEKQSE